MSESSKIPGEFWRALEHSPLLMVALDGVDMHSEPLTTFFDPTFPDTLFFYVDRDNRLVQELNSYSMANASFMSTHHGIFASLKGHLSLTDDVTLLKHFWSTSVEGWFDKGLDDPALRMLRINLTQAEVWQSDASLKVKLKRLLTGHSPGTTEPSHTRAVL